MWQRVFGNLVIQPIWQSLSRNHVVQTIQQSCDTKHKLSCNHTTYCNHVTQSIWESEATQKLWIFLCNYLTIFLHILFCIYRPWTIWHWMSMQVCAMELSSNGTWNTTTYPAIMFQELDKIYQEYQPARRHNFPTDKTQTIYTLNHNSASL